MADLKEINEDALLKAIAEAEAYAHQVVARAAQQAVEDIRQVIAARAALPARATDLLQDAVVAEVAEVDIQSYGDALVEFHGAYFMRQGGGQQKLSPSQGNPTRIKPGRYRAMFFLLPARET